MIIKTDPKNRKIKIKNKKKEADFEKAFLFSSFFCWLLGGYEK